MTQSLIEMSRKVAALVAMTSLLSPAALPAQQSGTGYTFKAKSELVLVNVSVRDKNGNLVQDLKPEDFTVLEDNKPQKVATFDIENAQNTPRIPMNQVNLLSSPAQYNSAGGEQRFHHGSAGRSDQGSQADHSVLRSVGHAA